jgi:hypothetical protein
LTGMLMMQQSAVDVTGLGLEFGPGRQLNK